MNGRCLPISMPVLQEAIQAQTAGQHWLLEKPNNIKQQPFEDWENLLSHVVPQQIIPVYSVSTNSCHIAFPDSGCFVKIAHIKQKSATNRNSSSDLEIMLGYSAVCKHQRLPSRENQRLAVCRQYCTSRESKMYPLYTFWQVC